MFKCASCKTEAEVCYTDQGVLGMTHGCCLCRDCYIKDGHPECPECGELCYESWKFCGHCGADLKK